MKNILNLFILALVLFLGRQSNNSSQPQEILTYHGKVVVESAAPWLAKGIEPAGKIEENPPSYTVYGQVNDTNVYLAQGGEQLPIGAWTDQVLEDIYTVTLFQSSSITFETLTLVMLVDAVGCQYLDANNEWITVDSDMTVYVKAIVTGDDGSCIISTNKKCGFGDDDDLIIDDGD